MAGARHHDEDRRVLVPRLPPAYVERRELSARLDQATQRPVALLVAPAGAGKTVGTAGWLHRAASCARPGEVVHGAVWAHGGAGWDVARFERLLDRSPEVRPDGAPPLTVVDDAHLLPAPVLRALDRRLEEAPESLRLLLIGRQQPHLDLLTPELHGQLTVLRGDVLRLDDDEATALALAHVPTASPQLVRAIAEGAEGWCAALVLTARAALASREPESFLRDAGRWGAGVIERVGAEVFATLTQAERHLLLCTAAEDPVLPAEACALTGDPGAGEVLMQLATTGLLVSSLAGPGGGTGLARIRATGSTPCSPRSSAVGWRWAGSTWRVPEPPSTGR